MNCLGKAAYFCFVTGYWCQGFQEIVLFKLTGELRN